MLLIYMFLLTSCYIKMVKTFSNAKSFKILSDFKLKKKGGDTPFFGQKTEQTADCYCQSFVNSVL